MADIKNLTVLPRPRSAWQAMDAGFTLARAHYLKLVMLWLGFALPMFVLCAIVQYFVGWSWILLVFWWFKPLYELPMTFYLSRALFSENLTMRAAWKMTLSQLGTLFKTYLTLARFSPARSMTSSVVFLEQLPRKMRAKRIQALTMVPTRHFTLIYVCFKIEFVLVYGIITIFAALFLSAAFADIDWESLLYYAAESPQSSPWLLATSLTSLIAAALVAPFYVSGGFLIYINRRMQLEAWDIEHRFRRMQPRSSIALASAALLAICLSTSDPTIAAERAQSLNSPAEVAVEVQNILDREDFGATKTRKVPVFDKDKDKEEEDDDENSPNVDWIKGFLKWMFGESTSSFAAFMKLVLWGAIGFFVVLLIYTLLQFKAPKRKTGKPLSRLGQDGEDAKSHPLTQNLPDDIVSAAEHLLQHGERRQALSVLFRGALRAVMDEYDLKVSRGATESDCKTSVSSVADENQTQTFSNLLKVWQKEAYANQPQQEQLISSLIADWKQAFTGRAQFVADQPGSAS